MPAADAVREAMTRASWIRKMFEKGAEMKRLHGDRLSFWGGVSTQKLLPYASVEEVEQQIDGLLEMGKNGGYVIAPAHAIPGDAKVENMEVMLRKILDQGD